MTRFLIIVALLIGGGWWLIDTILNHPGTAAITWGTWHIEMKTATLIFVVLAICLTFYSVLRTLLHLFGLRRRFRRMRQVRLAGKASSNLTQGLIQLAEGHWDTAEKMLTEYAEFSETPLLNYLTAARAAHMQQQPERRDELLRQAIEHDSKAQIAVGVSQAEMQMSDSQLEQAHATLLNLRNIAPKNTYVLKLYAKTLYRQENWEELLKLLPELLKHKLLESDSNIMKAIQSASLQGAFAKYAAQQNTDQLQLIWKKIPQPIKEQKKAARLYAQALHTANGDKLCAQFITSINPKNSDEALTELYGQLYHSDLQKAIKQAEQWLADSPDNPVNLMLLARLHRQQKLWGIAKAYYESSLNQSPDATGYLELAELLEIMDEPGNAEQCYRTGLRYSIHHKSERLVLTASNRPQPRRAMAKTMDTGVISNL